MAQSSTVIFIMCLDEFVDKLPQIKRGGFNAISIRDSHWASCVQNNRKYEAIDAAGLDNLHAVILTILRSLQKSCF